MTGRKLKICSVKLPVIIVALMTPGVLLYGCGGLSPSNTGDQTELEPQSGQDNPGGILPDQPSAAREIKSGKAALIKERQQRKVTLRQRLAAAARQSAARLAKTSDSQKALNAQASTNGMQFAQAVPGGAPNWYTDPNWAFSPNLQKFMDTLPGLNAPNNLGQMIPVAVPDTITFPGSDYYEIAVRDFTEKMHTQLPPTKLRGYVQINNGTDGAGNNTVAPAPIHYLGPLIVTSQNHPVRVKFINQLATGQSGDLFIPVDTTVMGAGMGPLDIPDQPGMKESYTQNRATLHLHGGENPWISDGTPHQWTVPAGEVTQYPRGVSTQFVPDMWFDPVTHAVVPAGTAGATNDPGPGAMTFYYPSPQSARLQFYHDHAYGITRLNVYAGEAAGFLITDNTEATLVGGGTLNGVPISAGTLPADQIPLIIQDKTFVNAATVLQTDPTWNWGSTPGTPNTGDLWFPHVYMPNQNPNDIAGVNPFGRWDYGPFFWPPVTTAAGLIHGPVVGDGTNGCAVGETCPGIPYVSMVMEAFMDTPLINGTAYPKVTLAPKPYRFRILNACNDRFMNLQLYYADPMNIVLTNAGSGYSANPTIAITGGGGSGATATAQVTGVLSDITVTSGGSGYSATPMVEISGGGGVNATAEAVVVGGAITGFLITNPGLAYTSAPTVTITDLTGTGATATAVVNNTITSITVTNPGTGYTSAPTVTITDPTGTGATAAASVYTEVRMVPAIPSSLFPSYWPTMDSRPGGVPDPTMAGPPILVYGTEGGVLPQPAILRNTPIGYDMDKRSITINNVLEHTLLLGSAERADIVVDFSAVPAGSTLILYNDSPAPVPAGDQRLDYYTGGQDLTSVGGAPMTLPGFGPNTRTLMQIQIAGTAGAPFNLPKLAQAIPAAHNVSQPAPVIPEPAFGSAYGTSYPPVYSRIADNQIMFTPAGTTAVGSVTVTAGGNGYRTAPTVSFGGPGTGAAATATISGGVAAVTMTNQGRNYVAGTTTVSFAGGGGTGAAATATIGNGGSVTGITVTNTGSGYSSAPTVTITGAGTGATATSRISASVTAVTVTNGGSGYTSAPTVSLSGGNGSGATATASLAVIRTMLSKAIHELFELDYGRMNALLGVELPFTNFQNQTTIPYNYIDPPIDILTAGESQLWKITHNGVDTHAIHFHLINVQVVNRVDWAGVIKPPSPDEVGWKETVRMNPLEDVIVAFRANVPPVPFTLPDSVRLLNPAVPEGTTWQSVNPLNNTPITITNVMTNFGHEYVWHCHILGHEEMDMMRPLVLRVAPAAPTITTAASSALSASLPSVTVSWVNNAINPAATLFTLQRSPDSTFTTNVTTITPLPLSPTIYTDTGPLSLKTTYYYRVRAENSAAASAWSDVMSAVTPGQLPQPPTGLTVTGSSRASVSLSWTNGSTAAPNATRTSVVIQYRIGTLANPWVQAASRPANTTSYTVSFLRRNTLYSFRVLSVNLDGSNPSGIVTRTTAP